MDDLTGCLTAKLAEKGEHYPQELIDEINRAVTPPRTVGPDDVYIRAMYIVSDQINSQGGRFVEEELHRLAELLIDSPVMVGHQHDSLPVARNFKAEKVTIDGRKWVRSFFYWMKESAGAEDLKNNIDGGIYKECSVSFLFRLPECSICGADIRECRHIPFAEYEIGPGQKEIAYFKYRKIEKVLETSLVYRGAVPDTRISSNFEIGETDVIPETITTTLFAKTAEAENPAACRRGYADARIQYHAIDEWPGETAPGAFYSFPHQPGMVVRGTWKKDGIHFESKRLLSEKVQGHLVQVLSQIECSEMKADFLLYATRGKQRQDGRALSQVIESGENLHRLRIRFCDLIAFDGEDYMSMNFPLRLNRLGEIVGDAGDGSVEILRVHDVKSTAAADIRSQSEYDLYNFGIEILEDGSRGLVRNIIRPESVELAAVSRVAAKSREHLNCKLTPFLDKDAEVGITVPRVTGLTKHDIVLIRRCRKSRPGKVIAVLVDVLPGVEPSDVIISCERAAEKHVMYISEGKGYLTLYFTADNRWCKATIYHFSRRLFEKGRRFISTLEVTDEAAIKAAGAQAVVAESITSAGKLMRLTVKDGAEYFGEVRIFWLRPVLIDGEEKYLFYSDEINCHQEGL